MPEETKAPRRVWPNGARVRVGMVDHHGLNRDDVGDPPADSVGKVGVICGNVMDAFGEDVSFLGHAENVPDGRYLGENDIILYRVQLFAEGEIPGEQYHYADYELERI